MSFRCGCVVAVTINGRRVDLRAHFAEDGPDAGAIYFDSPVTTERIGDLSCIPHTPRAAPVVTYLARTLAPQERVYPAAGAAFGVSYPA